MEYHINMVGLDGEQSYPQHSHSQYEIVYYLEGTGYQRTLSGDLHFSPGTIIVFPPAFPHGTVSTGGFKLLAIRCDKFESLFNFSEPLKMRDTENGDGAALINMIYRNRFNKDSYLSSLIDAFCHFILQNQQSDDSLSLAVQKIADKISGRFFDCNLNLAVLLRESSYAEDYIRAHFKKMTGKTPNNFLTTLRINHALYLIEIYKDSVSLADISEKCGYLDYVYFSKKFKEHTGISPKTFLKSCIKKEKASS